MTSGEKPQTSDTTRLLARLGEGLLGLGKIIQAEDHRAPYESGRVTIKPGLDDPNGLIDFLGQHVPHTKLGKETQLEATDDSEAV